MVLEAGRRLGHFEVLSPLGAGGMGEVYRARDSRLGREVALKVLPEPFAANPERVARFEREARLLATLSHPGIAAIHGIEEADGVRLLVLELVEGKTLAERLDRGALSLHEALEAARQIAEALGAAHERGILHRDLKPANIKLTPKGQVKLLDFGLAKILDSQVDGPGSDAATDTDAPTRAGAILGTAPYMSPEQARGQQLDRGCDIWAFGCVLYEMLTGSRAFQGATTSDTIAVILGGEPDWARLPPETHPRVRVLLARCLQKDARRRLHDIADARLEIEDAQAGPPAASETRLRHSWPRIALALALGVMVGAGVVRPGGWPTRSESAPWSPKRLSLQFPADAPLAPPGRDIAFSPDGRSFVYRSAGARRGLYLRRLERFDSALIPGTEDAGGAFFSPDGSRLAFFSGGKLRTVLLAGGTSTEVCDAPEGVGGSWAPDDTIVFAPRTVGGLFRVSAAGGEARPLTVPERAEQDSHRFPQVLPGGKAAVFTIQRASGREQERAVAVVRLDTGRWHILEPHATFGRYSQSGHLLFVRTGALYAAPFDLEGLELRGKTVPVLEGVQALDKYSGVASFSVSSTGILVYTAARADISTRQLVWVDRTGRREPAAAERRSYLDPALSPDGRRVAVTVEGDTNDVWVLDLALQTWSRPSSGGDNETPVWTPDGKRIAFRSNRAGSYNLFWVPFDGRGPAEQLTSIAADWHTPLSFAGAGASLLYAVDGASGYDVSVLPLAGDRRPRPLLHGPQFIVAHVSPDGRWVAYTAGPEVYVRPYPGPGPKWPVWSGGGSAAVWARDGRELFFIAEGRMMAAAVRPGEAFGIERPHPLFDALSFEGGFDVAPDGRFLMVNTPGGAADARSQLVVIPDWFDELKARLSGTASARVQ